MPRPSLEMYRLRSRSRAPPLSVLSDEGFAASGLWAFQTSRNSRVHPPCSFCLREASYLWRPSRGESTLSFGSSFGLSVAAGVADSTLGGVPLNASADFPSVTAVGFSSGLAELSAFATTVTATSPGFPSAAVVEAPPGYRQAYSQASAQRAFQLVWRQSQVQLVQRWVWRQSLRILRV